MATITYDDEKKAGFPRASESELPEYASTVEKISALVHEDHSHDIKLRTMSWQKATWLLCADQVCLAIMAQTWSLSVLGWVPGIITMLGALIFFYLMSLSMHKFIMANPGIRDICDYGYLAFGKSNIAYWFSAVMLLLNNIMLIGFHVLTGAKVLNTLSDHSACTVVFSVIVMLLGILLSIPRTLRHVSFMGVFSSICMGIAILLFLVFAGIEKAPLYGYNGSYPTDGEVRTYAFPLPDTTWVAWMNAVLNITDGAAAGLSQSPHRLGGCLSHPLHRTTSHRVPILGPVLYSSSFWQSRCCCVQESLVRVRDRTNLDHRSVQMHADIRCLRKANVLFQGVIYANVTAKFIYARIMGTSRHGHSNTVIGWGVWVAVMAAIWGIAFIFGSVIPSMGDFLSILGAAFDSFFGFIYFSVSYYSLHRGMLFAGVGRTVNTIVHVLALLVGLFLLGPGLYAAIEAIMADYAGATRPAFSCANLSL